MPFVTTVIPVYNTERFIGETLMSVARQTRRPDRLVILDNCSTDRTPEIAHEFIRAHPDLRIDWIRNDTNIGMIPNFNRALDFAEETDCLHILSADDLIEPRFFERVLPHLEGCPGRALAYSQLRFINECGQLIPPFPKAPGVAARKLSVSEFLSNQSELRHIYCQSVILRTNRQPTPARFRMDWQQAVDVVFFADWGRHCERIVEVPEPLCSFRIYTASGTGQNASKLEAWVLEEWRAMRMVADMISESPFSSWLRIQKQKCIFAARSKVKMQMVQTSNPDYAARIAKETKAVTGPLHWMLGLAAVKLRDAWRGKQTPAGN